MALAWGCGGGGADFKTVQTLPTGPRRPDGVAIDQSSAPPRARDAARTQDGLVTLRTPLGVDLALSTVETFFSKVLTEDAEGMEELFTRDALALNLSTGNPGGSPSAALFWTQRLRRLDYTKLAGETVYREPEVEIYRADDALETSPHAAIKADALGESDVVARVPIATSRVGADRLLGDEVVLWLRREGNRYRIYRIVEDFQLP